MAISHEILILPGDGIGVEVVPVAQEIMEVVAGRLGIKLVFEKALVGGKAIDEMGEPLPKDTLDLAKRARAILLGSVELLEKKMEKLMLFYTKGVSQTGWNNYQLINLKYKNQIVCVKR